MATNEKRFDTRTIFSEAVKGLIQREGRGAKLRIAKAMEISPQYLSDLTASRKKWSDSLMDKIATQLGRSTLEIMEIGGCYIMTGIIFPHVNDVRKEVSGSWDRLIVIFKYAAKEAGLLDTGFITKEAIESWTPLPVDRYLEGKVSDCEAWVAAVHFFDAISSNR